jgi:UDP-N-acetylmuramoylalanine--D-glutamate ligase
MSLERLALQGKHNIYNSMAAAVSGSLLDIRKQHIQESLSDFQNIEHRLEHVAVIQGIEFINDSKATNVNAVWYALEDMPDNVIWIAGGIDKGNDYEILKDLVSKKVKAIICLGKDNKHLLDAFSGVVDSIIETFSMEVAVRAALYMGKKGDTVLLSPACASFDLFENYEDRGKQFKESVNSL